MSDKVEHEELQAILDAVDDGTGALPAAEVQPRNFRQPRRLSRERLQYLAQLVNASLNGICRDISSPLRQHHKVSLASVSEVNVFGLFDGYDPPFVADVFECGGHVSWVLWDSVAAAAAVETILSGPPLEPSEEEEAAAEAAEAETTSNEPRRLSRSESRVVEGLLQKVLTPVAAAFGLEVSQGRLAQEPEELTTIEDCGPDSDARRLMLHFLFEGPGGPSDIRIYLPDIGEEDLVVAEESPEEMPLPDHLGPVHLDVSAFLASVDIPLHDLMSLEVGDVIPLGVEEGCSIQLYVEDRCCAEGTWGRSGNQQVVRIENLDPRAGTIEDPGD